MLEQNILPSFVNSVHSRTDLVSCLQPIMYKVWRM